MPERRHDLLGRLVEADSFARGPGNFAGSPVEPNGCILRNPERGQNARRGVLHR